MEGLSDVTSGITRSITSVFNTVKDILEFIVTIPQLIIEGLTNALKFLFIPENNYFNDKITTFKNEFGFINSISEGADTFKKVFESDDIGQIEIDLSKVNSKYNYGGKTFILSLEWYTPYKPIGDKIISAFLWLTFILNVYKSLPSIINGGSSAYTISSKLEGGNKE